MPVRILIADNSETAREGLRGLIDSHPDLQLSGEAEDGSRAVELAARLKPDMLITEVSLPRLNGTEVVRQLRRDHAGIGILAHSAHSDKRFIVGMLGAGADGYLVKGCSSEEIHLAIRVTARGGRFLSSGAAGILIEDYLRQISLYSDPFAESNLTGREREVLGLIAEGLSTRRIAASLAISVKTVESHRRNIMDKLNARGVADLTRYAIRMGLTTLDR